MEQLKSHNLYILDTLQQPIIDPTVTHETDQVPLYHTLNNNQVDEEYMDLKLMKA